MKVTIQEIANAVGCSVSTVSKAISGSSDISVKMREKILECAFQLGYDTHKDDKKKNGRLAAVAQCSDFDAIRFEYHMLFGFSMLAERAGYDVDVIKVSPRDNLWDFQKNVGDKNYDGIFLLRLSNVDDVRKKISNCTKPIVAFDNKFGLPKTAFVGSENSYGISLAIKHLADLGHKRIAFFGGTPGALVSVERKKSFIAAMREAGLEILPELIVESSFSQNHAQSIVPDFLENKATAIVCASDLLASYAIAELKKFGVRVPQDMSVVGYDNVPLAEDLNLTTIDQDITQVGKSAFLVLEQMINGVDISGLVLRPKLIERGSTATCKIKYGTNT